MAEVLQEVGITLMVVEKAILFVWDWNCQAKRIASNFTRFYRIAKSVIRRIWLDLCPVSPSYIIDIGKSKKLVKT